MHILFIVAMLLVIWGLLGVMVGVFRLVDSGYFYVDEGGPPCPPVPCWLTILLGPIWWICVFGDWLKGRSRSKTGQE